jgi:hypothetical protein
VLQSCLCAECVLLRREHALDTFAINVANIVAKKELGKTALCKARSMNGSATTVSWPDHIGTAKYAEDQQ